MAGSFNLEHRLDSLASLPGELRRNFKLMHEIDDKNQNILREVDAASEEYFRQAKDLNSNDRKVEMEKIQQMFKTATEFGDEKVSIAIQTYEIVDKHIRRLDKDLAKFEAEIREKGRLSQTETEDEDDNHDDNPNEPIYCICKRVSYGEMIGCDNENCSIEWFHFECVNVVTKPPKGKWYCPHCLPLFRKENKTQNFFVT